MEAWSNFFIAEAGATAALAGLVIVAISINLSQVLALPQLPGRAGETLVVLVGVLIISTLALVPGQPRWLLGTEWLAIGAVMWAFPTAMVVRGARLWAASQPLRQVVIRVSLMQAASLPIIIAGASMLLGHVGGIYWIVPGVVFSLVGAVVNTWVLLVEILR
jgi:modulator of FtsH protease